MCTKIFPLREFLQMFLCILMLTLHFDVDFAFAIRLPTKGKTDLLLSNAHLLTNRKLFFYL